MDNLSKFGDLEYEIVNEDFCVWALRAEACFDICIQNPPYGKIPNSSEMKKGLLAHGINVPNSYAAFMALGAALLLPDGQQISITPRSWMNGTYYKSFRDTFTDQVKIRAIHLFESRKEVFKDTGVLQEAVIVSAQKSDLYRDVKVTYSVDHKSEVNEILLPYSEVVTGNFVHIPVDEESRNMVHIIEQKYPNSLEELGLSVSTGKIVDFRSRDLLSEEPLATSVPMIYPSRISIAGVDLNKPIRKPGWFQADSQKAERMLLPPGAYVLLKRFSSKEEKRRLVACVYESREKIALDNKLNYFHADGKPLPRNLAYGLATWINTEILDDYFRVFSGHTQVNAADMRAMPYPSLAQLTQWGVEAQEGVRNSFQKEKY